MEGTKFEAAVARRGVATKSHVVATKSFVVATKSFVVATKSFVVATKSFVVATKSFVVATKSFVVATKSFVVATKSFVVATKSFVVATKSFVVANDVGCAWHTSASAHSRRSMALSQGLVSPTVQLDRSMSHVADQPQGPLLHRRAMSSRTPRNAIMATPSKATPSKTQVKLTTMADGLGTSSYALLNSLVVLGATLAKAEIISKLRAYIALYVAVAQAKASYTSAVA